MYLQQLAMFPDMAKPEHYDEAALPMDLEDTEALMLDLATILPPEASPPHSPSPIFELDELLKLRAQEVLPDPDDDLLMDMLPPTPSDSGASSSPSYAPSTPASIYSDSSNDPEWSPEPLPGPSKARRKPYTRTKQPVNRAERKRRRMSCCRSRLIWPRRTGNSERRCPRPRWKCESSRICCERSSSAWASSSRF
jgi:hypothetical protein